jgi:hypothetical protein
MEQLKINYYTPFHTKMKKEGKNFKTPYILANKNTILKNLEPIKKMKTMEHLRIFNDDNNMNLDDTLSLADNNLYDDATIYIGPGTYEYWYTPPHNTSVYNPETQDYVNDVTVMRDDQNEPTLAVAETVDFLPQQARIINETGLGNWGSNTETRIQNPMTEGGKRKKRNSRKLSRKKSHKKLKRKTIKRRRSRK